MMAQKRLLWFGFLVPDGENDQIFAGERHPQVAALRFQHGLLRALAATGVSIDAITTPPIPAFPRHRHWWVSGKDFHLRELKVHARQIGGPNLPAVRLGIRFAQFVRHGWSRLRAPYDGLLVYSVHTPLVAAALVLKRLRDVPVFVIIPDRPTFMGGPSNPMKRFLKRIDEWLVRRMLARTDGVFPVAEGTGRDWLAGVPPYHTVEGVSDEAADILRGARTSGAYVFRGTRGRPNLLYTGTLAQVVRFAQAFHRSPIDATVTFMGGGEERTELESLASRDERIMLKPFAIGQDLAREVARADFLLNPRDPDWPGANYSFPWKLFDYLRYGKPIISTRLGAVPDEYFAVFRSIELRDQVSFEISLERALAVDAAPWAIWSGAERIADRLDSALVGARILRRMEEWTSSR